MNLAHLRVLPIVAAFAALSLLAAGPASAAVSFVSIVNASTAPTLDNSFGSLDLAYNFTNTLGTGTLLRDGITFTNKVVTGTNVISINYGTTGGINVAASTSVNSNWSNATLTPTTDTLYQSISFPSNSRPYTMSITGLDPTRTYQVQVMHSDPRSQTFGVYTNGTVNLTDSLSNLASTQLTFGTGPTPNANVMFALVTMEVFGSTSLTYAMSTTTARGPDAAGVVIHSILTPVIPAPAALPAGLALIGLIAARRRRHA